MTVTISVRIQIIRFGEVWKIRQSHRIVKDGQIYFCLSFLTKKCYPQKKMEMETYDILKI